MSWTSIRPYFKTHFEAEGLYEWDEPFDFTNIPATLLDGAFHIEFGDFSGVSVNQNDFETLVTVTCRIFKKGYANPVQARDDAIVLASAIVVRCLNPINRLNQTFKNVESKNTSIQKLSEQNDNALGIEMTFEVRSILEVCS